MNARHRSRAFSLVEVLCAILVLGVGVAGMTHGVASALRGSQDAELQTQAVLLAAGRLEALRAEGFLVEGETEGTGLGSLADYRWRESIRVANLEGLYEVSVAVRHGDRDTVLYELKTLLFDPPVASESPADGRQARDRQPQRRGR